MVQAAKEIGFLWAFCVYCLLINADERGKRLFLHDLFQSGQQDCESYTEYKELRALENDGQCHSFDTVIPKLRDLHERSTHCMHAIIGKMKTYYSSPQNKSGGCKCSGHVAYHPETHHNGQWTCKNHDHNFDVLYKKLFGNDNTGPCLLHDEVWASLGSLSVHYSYDCQWEIINHYSTMFDANGPRCNCSHENMHVNATVSHTALMTTIALEHTTAPTAMKESTPSTVKTTINPTTPESVATITALMTTIALEHTTAPTAIKESASSTVITTINPTTPESVATITAPVLHTCMKATTISMLAHGVQQSNPNAGNCHPATNDHQAPEALVMNMCNVAGAPDAWTSGQNVMSVCASIPLYTPVATFFHGKYHSQGGHAGIFIGCLLDGFKIIVQECDQNITVIHVTTGHQPDPVNYFIIM